MEHLIFSSEPDVEVVNYVLNAALQSKIITNELEAFSLDLDDTTKKLLIQLIFKNYQKSYKYLNEWFEQSTQNNNNSEIALNFMLCVEEQFFDKTIEKTIDEEINTAKEVSQDLLSSPQLEFILNDQRQTYNIESLFYLAKLKFVLKILAKATNNQDMLDSIKIQSQFNLLCSNVQTLIEPTLNYTSLIYNFLIKELVRRYSFSSIKFISNNRALNWLTPKQIIGHNLDISDRYILIGNKYTKIKKAIKNAFEIGNTTELENVLSTDTEKIFPYFLICIYKNVLLVQKNIDLLSCEIIKNPFDKYYSKNSFYLQEITKMSQNASDSIELNLLLLQLKYSIKFSNNNLIIPLADLMESPDQFKASFIPCMPQDIIYDNYIAVREARTNDNPTLYGFYF